MTRTRANYKNRPGNACFRVALGDRTFGVSISSNALHKRRSPDGSIKMIIPIPAPGCPRAELILSEEQVDQCIRAVMETELANREKDPVSIPWGQLAVNMKTDLFTKRLFIVDGHYV